MFRQWEKCRLKIQTPKLSDRNLVSNSTIQVISNLQIWMTVPQFNRFAFVSLFLSLSLTLSLSSTPPRHVCEDSLRARQAKSLCQHLSVKLSSTTTRTLQRGARGAAPIRRSQRLQSSHEPRRATH